MTADNLTSVMWLIKEANRWPVLENLGIPSARLNVTKRLFTTVDKQITSLVDYYVNCHYQPTWSSVYRGLYNEGVEVEALRKAQMFLSCSNKHEGSCHMGPI